MPAVPGHQAPAAQAAGLHRGKPGTSGSTCQWDSKKYAHLCIHAEIACARARVHTSICQNYMSRPRKDAKHACPYGYDTYYFAKCIDGQLGIGSAQPGNFKGIMAIMKFLAVIFCNYT
eukprot:scaffold12733_cov20-Tisochrysis_lutea.AAC.1